VVSFNSSHVRHDTLYRLRYTPVRALEGAAIPIEGDEATHFFFGAAFFLATFCFFAAAFFAVTVFQALAVVTNNGPDSVGGGGTAVVALAPPICRDDAAHPQPR
jgi:hypothetical protein